MAASSVTLQHVGEWKVELRADSLPELFAELARVLAHALDPREPPRSSNEWEQVELTARDHATLLVDWANELIGRSEVSGRTYRNVRNLIVEPLPAMGGESRARDASSGTVRLSGEVSGEPVEVWMSPVKAATYHGLALEQRGNEWRAQVLLDV